MGKLIRRAFKAVTGAPAAAGRGLERVLKRRDVKIAERELREKEERKQSLYSWLRSYAVTRNGQASIVEQIKRGDSKVNIYMNSRGFREHKETLSELGYSPFTHSKGEHRLLEKWPVDVYNMEVQWSKQDLSKPPKRP